MQRLLTSLRVILQLCIKEIFALASDGILVAFIIYAFTFAIYVQATGTSIEVRHASIGIVDEDQSAFSRHLQDSFLPPRFKPAASISASDVD